MIKTFETTHGSFTIRPYQKDDELAICTLFRDVFSQEKALEHWRWEFVDNPYGTQIILCEHESGELVAQCAAIPVPIYHKGDIFMSAQLVDCMSKKSYRGLAVKKKGLFYSTVQMFVDSYTGKDRDILLYGFPSERHYRLGSLLLEYRKMLPYLNVQLTHPAPRHNFGKRLVMFTPEELSRETAALLQLHARDLIQHDLCLYKEPKYLEWRYCNAPRDYTMIGLRSPLGKLLSVAFLRKVDKAFLLLDFFGYEQINRLLGQFMAETENRVTLWLQKRHFSLLNHVEIIDDRNEAIPVCRSFYSSLDQRGGAQNEFFYTMGDCDLF